MYCLDVKWLWQKYLRMLILLSANMCFCKRLSMFLGIRVLSRVGRNTRAIEQPPGEHVLSQDRNFHRIELSLVKYENRLLTASCLIFKILWVIVIRCCSWPIRQTPMTFAIGLHNAIQESKFHFDNEMRKSMWTLPLCLAQRSQISYIRANGAASNSTHGKWLLHALIFHNQQLMRSNTFSDCRYGIQLHDMSRRLVHWLAGFRGARRARAIPASQAAIRIITANDFEDAVPDVSGLGSPSFGFRRIKRRGSLQALEETSLEYWKPTFVLLMSLQRSCLGFLWACLNLSRSFLQSKIAEKRESSWGSGSAQSNLHAMADAGHPARVGQQISKRALMPRGCRQEIAHIHLVPRPGDGNFQGKIREGF